MDRQRCLSSESGPAKSSPEAANLEESKPKIYKLNINCFEAIFDYLSLEDLSAFSQTCKLMQKVSGHVLRSKYPFLRTLIDEYGNCSSDRFDKRTNLNMLVEYVEPITLATDLNTISLSQWKRFKSVKYLCFMSCILSNDNLEAMQTILDTVNAVELRLCEFESTGFIRRLFELCTNLKHLTVRCSLDYDDTAWLQHKYPKLEHLAILPMTNQQINELPTFFERNATLRNLLVDSDFLWINRMALTHVKLKELFIYLSNDFCYDFNNAKMMEYFGTLNRWHAEGVYKRLHIIGEFKQQIVDKLITVKGLVGLKSTALSTGTDLGSLGNLEILYFDHITKDNINTTQLAQSLKSLKAICFYDADFSTILPFIQHSPKLKRVIIKFMDTDDERNELFAFNRERKALCEITSDVSKVTIYIPEMRYLQIRRKSVTMYMDLIEIRPFEQYETVLFYEC